MSQLRVVLTTLLLLTVAACGTTDYYPGYDADGSPTGTTPALSYQPGNGVVESIAVVDAGGRTGIGAVAGGVVGAILGSQVGSGSGRAAATVAGAGGGAYVGHQIERRARPSSEAYQLTVRMENGVVQNIVQDNRNFQVGDRVQITRDGRVILL